MSHLALPPPAKNGFSLVELSIVLVILGLLVGGVLSGQSLIRAAELRAVTGEYARYITSVQTFRDKYFAIPGDMANATRFWGKDDTNCTGDTGTNATPGTCNGNADGIMTFAGGNGDNREIRRFWQHLALAGLIEGSYNGPHTGIGVLGVNQPKSRLSNAGWATAYTPPNFPGDESAYAVNYGNFFRFGTQKAGSSGADGPVLKPEEVWNIDTKMDDGKPAYGNLIAVYWDDCTLAESRTDLDKAYQLTETGNKCTFYVRNIF
jgi:prepilin-type N-terminal cleavage/methylation domain-containing protein